MITARPQKNLKAAKNYFREHLAKGDYYSEGETIQGYWFGKGIERLGLDLAAPVSELAYTRLCDNLHPVTGTRLTVRQRKMDRRVFYDFVVSAPKSISVMALLAGDARIVAAHDAASRVALHRMEQVAATRIRKDGRRSERTTGEITAAVFRHDTSRALDPQLHTHFVIFNATWDATEKRWKALEPSAMFDQMTFFTEVYRSDLALRLRALGYQLRNTANGFEIDGVPPVIIDRYSKRRRQIVAEESKLTTRLGQPISNNARAAVAHASRDAKRKDLTSAQVLAHQSAQLDASEWKVLRSLIKAAQKATPPPRHQIHPVVVPALTQNTEPSESPPPTSSGTVVMPAEEPPDDSHQAHPHLRKPTGQPSASEAAAPAAPPSEADPKAAIAAIDHAREHLFERYSVVAVHEVLREGLAFARGQTGLTELEAELDRRTEFIKVGQSLTTKETLLQEQQMVAAVNQGAGRCRPLNATFAGDVGLTDEQRLALQLVLRSPDEVIALRGHAGTGKTRVLKEIVRGIEERHAAVVLAPTAAAVDVLRKEGLTQAATVQRFLADPDFQRAAQGKALIVDEASFLSVRNVLALVEMTRTLHGRLILSGDTRQHSGVEAGDALRLLEERSSLQSIRLTRVQRQVAREYRAAITELSRGQGARALRRLEKLGAVVEMDDAERYQHLAADYVGSVKAGKTALIVSPTWREIDVVTGAVRAQLKAGNLLAREDTVVTTHQSLKWTRAQKRDLLNYQPGMIVSFHKPTTEFSTGEWAEVIGVDADKLRVRKPGRKKETHLTRKQADCFGVSRKEQLPVAAGEQLLVQGNRKNDGLFNGQIVTVQAVRPDGGIVLTDKRVIKPDFRAFTHGYCVTSHAAQGRTVDHVYVAVDSQTQQAANLNQFYVSTSRGREKVKIYTDDLEFLREAVTKPGARLSATELLESAHLALRETPDQRQTVKTGLSI